MDPLTVGLQLATKIVDAWVTFYEGASPETKAKVADQFFSDMAAWRALFERALPH